ncbi:Aspartic peptidase domain superfamily [Sesbania bispinosa]|nr:Aspartic peptidase domain superfamily [Sesbania bispinosa]
MGTVNDQQVVALIDCGASHNFISHELVERLKLPVKETSPCTVEVGDDHKVECKECVRTLSSEFKGRGQSLFWKANIDYWRRPYGEKQMVGDPSLTRS